MRLTLYGENTKDRRLKLVVMKKIYRLYYLISTAMKELNMYLLLRPPFSLNAPKEETG
jgi:hypothetical protein